MPEKRISTLRGNTLIADFLDYIHHEDKDIDAYEMANLQYHFSLDKLIRAVQAIEKIRWCDFKAMSETYLVEKKEKVTKLKITTPIKIVWQNVVEFIEWLNENHYVKMKIENMNSDTKLSRHAIKIQMLQDGKSFVSSEKGNSMTPLIYSGQPFELSPITLEKCKKGDIVYCKVHGKMYTHLVKAVSKKQGVLIGNNHGTVNGWTKTVYGKVTQVLAK